MGYGFGIVGCGMIAGFHEKAIADVDDAHLVAGFDVVPASADRFAQQTGCKPYHDMSALLAKRCNAKLCEPADDAMTFWDTLCDKLDHWSSA